MMVATKRFYDAQSVQNRTSSATRKNAADGLFVDKCYEYMLIGRPKDL